MKCSYCGQQVPDESKFCEHCGKKLEERSEAEGEREACDDAVSQKPLKPGRRKTALIIVLIVIFLGLAGTGVYFFMDRSSANDLYAYQDPDTGLWGYIDSSGKEVIKPQFKEALDFTEGCAAVCDDDTGLWGYIDDSGEYTVEPEYSEAYKFENGAALVCDDERWGYISDEGDYTIEPEFSDAYHFVDGIAAVCDADTGLWGFIDDSGTYVIEPAFKFTYGFSDGYASVQDGESGMWGFIDESGEYVIEPVFAGCDNFSEGYASVLDEDTELWGYIDESGEYVIDPAFEHAYPFSEDFAVICEADTGKWNYIDKEGTKLTMHPLSAASSFSGGLAAVCDHSGLWGYIDDEGIYAIKPQFEKAGAFTNGTAMVYRQDGSCDYINKNGKSIIGETPETNKSSSVEVETAVSYHGEIGPLYSSQLETEYYCDVDIDIPELSENVQGHKSINRDISWELSDFELLAEDLEAGDYATIENNTLAVARAGYGVHEYNDTTALVIEYTWMQYATGGDPNYMLYYFDNKNGEWIDYEEYAALNGYTLEEVFDEYVSEGNPHHVDITVLGGGEYGGVYFYFNEDGSLEFCQSLL